MNKKSLLDQLKFKEKSRLKNRYFFAIFSIFFYSLSYYAYSLYQVQAQNILEEAMRDEFSPFVIIHLQSSQHLLMITLLHFCMGLWFLMTSLNECFGSTERLAIISILENLLVLNQTLKTVNANS